MQLTFTIKTQQLSLKEQSTSGIACLCHVWTQPRHCPHMCAGAPNLAVKWWPVDIGSPKDSQHHPVLLSHCGSPKSCVGCLSQVTGWEKEGHQKRCFALPFERGFILYVVTVWTRNAAVLGERRICSEKSHLFQDQKREKPHRHCDMTDSPVKLMGRQ